MPLASPFAIPESNTGTTTVDSVTGAYLLGIGRKLRLCVMGHHYGAEEALPEAAFAGLNRAGNARRFVASHMRLHYGQDPSHWPLSARYFVQQS